MDKLTKGTFTTSRDLTYTYYHHVPSSPSHPTVLLLHGWPDSSLMWTNLITQHLLPAGYGTLAVDILGMGSSSKPTDVSAYNFHYLANDMAQILDYLSLSKVIALGHDWGSGVIQRLQTFHQDRVSGMAMINVAYVPPVGPFDLNTVNEQSKQLFGYPRYAYWAFFGADPEAPKIMQEHVESLFTACHTNPENMKISFCEPGGLKKWLLEDRRAENFEPYVTSEFREAWIDRLRKDGFDGACNYYRSYLQGEQDKMAKDAEGQSFTVEVPVLYVGFDRDYVSRKEDIELGIQNKWLPKLTTKTLNGGHWGFLAVPQEFGDIIVSWLKENF